MTNLTISIVSHGYGHLLADLLQDLNAQLGLASCAVMITWNAPELETVDEQALVASCVWPVSFVRHAQRQGFAENHNQAFANAAEGVWAVLNPDVRLGADWALKSMEALADAGAGLAFPRQQDAQGQAQDYKRGLVTPWALVARHVLKIRKKAKRVDWVSGCCVAFRSKVYRQLGGFDERYFLYCEDVDICLRVQLLGYRLAELDCAVLHDARRATLKNGQHFRWHVRSLLRLWCSKAFWLYCLR
jgi:N-acetylglucosaminyl-diphospho-decaprenol L-rhamnosyltransferase